MRILLHGLNYAPEELGIGKYSGEMIEWLAAAGHECVVVTTPPYYPQWRVWSGYRGARYRREAGAVEVIRCPLWAPRRPTGAKRVAHLASFGLSSAPVVFWEAITRRPDVVITVEPAAFCLPTAWLAARLCGARAWLHVQDFEIDAAFELGLLNSPLLKRLVLKIESLLMRRFDRVSSISPRMLGRLRAKGVAEESIRSFPNWVDCDQMRPVHQSARSRAALREQFGLPSDKVIALYAGSIGAKQGLEVIVEAASLLGSDPESRVHFVICGHGAAHAELCAMAHGVAGVQLLPVQPSARFNELLNCADVHLLPQRAGAADLVMPSKLTGMLATGRPVVACAAAGTQVANAVAGRGRVVPTGDAAALADAVRALSRAPGLRAALGAAARQYAMDHLGRDAILSRFERDLHALVAGERYAEAGNPAAPPAAQPGAGTARAPHLDHRSRRPAAAEGIAAPVRSPAP